MGKGVLCVAEGEGQEPSGGGACASLQVDQNHLSLLADADALRRGEVPGMFAEEGVKVRLSTGRRDSLRRRNRLTRTPQIACYAAAVGRRTSS